MRGTAEVKTGVLMFMILNPYLSFFPLHLHVSYEGETTAPNLLTEAELLTLMERHEIGTDATMVSLFVFVIVIDDEVVVILFGYWLEFLYPRYVFDCGGRRRMLIDVE